MKKISRILISILLTVLLATAPAQAAFAAASVSLSDVSFPSGTREIDADSIQDTDAQVIIIPESVTSITSDAFDGIAHNLTVVLPDGDLVKDQMAGRGEYFDHCFFYMENGKVTCRFVSGKSATWENVISGWAQINFLTPDEIYEGKTQRSCGLKTIQVIQNDTTTTLTCFVAKDGAVSNGWVCENGKVYLLSDRHDAALVTESGVYNYFTENYKEKSASFTFDRTGAVTSTLPNDMIVSTTESVNGVPIWQAMDIEEVSANRGLVRQNGEIYIYNEIGRMITGQWYQLDEDWYYLDEDGTARVNSWLYGEDGIYRYLGADGKMLKNQWLEQGNNKYYLDQEGRRCSGTTILNGTIYIFDRTDGRLLLTEGQASKNTVTYREDKAYLYDEKGNMLKSGWYEAGGEWYYLNDNGAGVVNCWRLKDGKYCYLKSDGKMARNQWIEDYDNWYYLRADGTRYESSWLKLVNTWYWFGGSGKRMENGWLKLADGKWYYFYSEGQMANGWVKDGGKWYYLSGSGAMVHDRWIQEGNKWYYFGSDGRMLTNTTTPDGYRVGADGAWLQ